MRKVAPKFPLVVVLWEDHHGTDSSDGWTSVSVAEEFISEPYLAWSVGWLVAENDERICVAPNLMDFGDDADMMSYVSISRKLIREFMFARSLDAACAGNVIEAPLTDDAKRLSETATDWENLRSYSERPIPDPFGKVKLAKNTASVIRNRAGITPADERRAKRALDTRPKRTIKPTAGKSKVTLEQATEAARKSR